MPSKPNYILNASQPFTSVGQSCELTLQRLSFPPLTSCMAPKPYSTFSRSNLSLHISPEICRMIQNCKVPLSGSPTGYLHIPTIRRRRRAIHFYRLIVLDVSLSNFSSEARFTPANTSGCGAKVKMVSDNPEWPLKDARAPRYSIPHFGWSEA